MTAPASPTPNTGRQPQPYDYEITEADRMADQGVSSIGDYYDIHGEDALRVVATSRPIGGVALTGAKPHTKDLVEFYGPDHNFKSGEIGGAWAEPGSAARDAFFEEVHKLDPKNKRTA